MTDTDTPEKRAYAIRLACGDGWKTPMPMAEFAALVKSKTRGVSFDAAKVSRIESGDQKMALSDIEAMAKIDPKKRGPAWLAFNTPAHGVSVGKTEVSGTDVTPATKRQNKAG